jgi:hypothetical protein
MDAFWTELAVLQDGRAMLEAQLGAVAASRGLTFELRSQVLENDLAIMLEEGRIVRECTTDLEHGETLPRV